MPGKPLPLKERYLLRNGIPARRCAAKSLVQSTQHDPGVTDNAQVLRIRICSSPFFDVDSHEPLASWSVLESGPSADRQHYVTLPQEFAKRRVGEFGMTKRQAMFVGNRALTGCGGNHGSLQMLGYGQQGICSVGRMDSTTSQDQGCAGIHKESRRLPDEVRVSC